MEPTTYKKLIIDLADSGYICEYSEDNLEFELSVSDFLTEEYFLSGINFIDQMYDVRIEENQDFATLLQNNEIYEQNGVLYSKECLPPLKFSHKSVNKLRKSLQKMYKLVDHENIYNIVNISLISYFINDITTESFKIPSKFEEEKENTIGNLERIKKHYKNKLVNTFLVQIICLKPLKEEE